METITPSTSATGCPIDHSQLSARKVDRPPVPTLPLECDDHGVWHIHRFDLVRKVLRSTQTRQGGFGVEYTNTAVMAKIPVLYAEGTTHTEQRKSTARFFTPTTVSTRYRQFIDAQVDHLIADFKAKRRADLSEISLALAVQTAARIVGLNRSLFNGMDQRLDSFFTMQMRPASDSPWQKLAILLNIRVMLAFFLVDVRPSIAEHRKHPQDDLISHLLNQGYNDREILTEVVTYAAAGMVTTREFISMAAWHFLEHPDLRNRYVNAPEEERQEILHEILRVEPIVGSIQRYATEPIALDYDGQQVQIPQGAKIDLDIYASNTEHTVVGDAADRVCPGREIQGDQIPSMLMSFGDGAHRCPGAYVAIQETDMLLSKLMALDGIHIAQKPTISWGDLSTGYELRNFIIAL
jgi:cytochrome P450